MGEERRRDPRVPVGLKVRVAYGSLEEFSQRQAANISAGGIFIRTRDLHPVGTPVSVDVRLHGGAKVIFGKGVIVRATAPAAPGEPPREAGIAIQLTELDDESRRLVGELVARLTAPPPAPAHEVDLDGLEERPPPPPPARPSPVVGIDLGTTNSCVAVSEGGAARVLASRHGWRTVPSVVAYDAQGRLLVGSPAKAQMVVNPRNTVYGAKRLLGRPFASPTVQACRDRFDYEIVEGEDGEAAVRLGERQLSLKAVTAVLLGDLRTLASEALGEDVRRAIVTVPAYYADHQRNAVREAARQAGLEVTRIVNEPTAAALAFGHKKGLRERLLVYDLGGGTFDASVLEVEDEVYEVVSTGGDTFLGGVDFDARLLDHLAAQFQRQHGIPPPPDPVARQRLRDAAEATKVALSARESAPVHVPYLGSGPRGEPLDLRCEVTRAQLEALTGDLVERTLDVCAEVLAARGLTTDRIDGILLVGGQSRMPLVARRIREVFGKEPSKGVHPDEAVAQGAALLAESEARIDSVVLIDVLAMGIGVGLPGGKVAPVVARNARLPVVRPYQAATTRDGQTELEVPVFQGDAALAADCEYLGTVRVGGLPARPKGEVKVDLEFALGAEGILSVRARSPASGALAAAELTPRETPEALRAKLVLPAERSPPKGSRPLADGARREPAAGKTFLGRLFGR